MKNIIITTGIFPPDIGGPATYSKIMAESLVEQGFNVSVITYGSKEKGDRNLNYKLIRVSRKWPKIIKHIIFFIRLFFITKNTDLIYSQNSISVGIPVLWVSRFRKKKFILKVVGDYAWETAQNKRKTVLSIEDFQKEKKKGFVNTLYKLQKKTAINAQTVIVPSKFLAKIISHWGVKEENIKIINNGVDSSPLQISREEARNKIGIHGNIILSVGRLVPWKGFKMLIKIMPKLLKLNSFFRLVIVGNGPEMGMLKKIVSNLRLKNRVYIVGKKKKEEVKEYFAAADMFVLNTFYEGFPHIIIEAMASGVPIITTKIGGNPEIIKQGENGFMIKFNDEQNLYDAIKTVSQNEDVKDKFIQNGFKTSRNFSNKKMIDKTLNLINIIINE